MERTWTTKGQGCKHTNTPDKMVRLGRIFNDLEWDDVSGGTTFGIPNADGINVAIHSLRIPNVSHVASSNEMAPYGLFAIRGHFHNGWADIYVCDEGHRLVVLATDFHQNDTILDIPDHHLN